FLGNGFSFTKTGTNILDIYESSWHGTAITGVKNCNVSSGTLIVAGSVLDNSQPGSIYVNSGGVFQVGEYAGLAVSILKPIVMTGGTIETSDTGSDGNATIAAAISLNSTATFSPQKLSVLTLNGAISNG